MLHFLIFLFLLFNPIGLYEMPDQKDLDVYKMAQQMDEQQTEAQEAYKTGQLENFLKAIGQIESSGGKDFSHEEIQQGIHKGHRAAGTYGLMPNTVYEVLNRMRQEGNIPAELESLQNLQPEHIKSQVEQNPEAERQIASHLAQRVLDRQQGDEEKAAYSWFQGHNLTPEEIEKRGYKEHDYVKKYRKYKGE